MNCNRLFYPTILFGSLAVRMRQHEPQAITFIEMLPVHVNPYIKKHRKSQSKRKRKRKADKQGNPEKVSWQYKAHRIRIISVYQENISQ